MNSLQTQAAPTFLGAAWQHCPWGMAAIGSEGNVLGVNPAFEFCTGIAASAALGLSEAALDARLGELQVEHHRVETPGNELRAIHYVRCSGELTAHELRLPHVVETLRESLGSIYGFAELLLTQNYDDETRRDLTATLLAQADTMANLINEHLDIRKSNAIAAAMPKSAPAARPAGNTPSQ